MCFCIFYAAGESISAAVVASSSAVEDQDTVTCDSFSTPQNGPMRLAVTKIFDEVARKLTES